MSENPSPELLIFLMRQGVWPSIDSRIAHFDSRNRYHSYDIISYAIAIHSLKLLNAILEADERPEHIVVTQHHIQMAIRLGCTKIYRRLLQAIDTFPAEPPSLLHPLLRKVYAKVRRERERL